MTDIDVSKRERAQKEILQGARALDDARVSLSRAAASVAGTSIADALRLLIARIESVREQIDTEAA